MKMLKTFLIFFFLITTLTGLQAQKATLELGKTTIPKNQYFTITVKVQNQRIRKISNFPDIPGFQKARISTSTSTNIINGQVSMEMGYTQNYIPQKEGKFKLGPFSMEVNGQNLRSQGAEITVTAPQQRKRRRSVFDWDPFGRQREQEFVDVKDDAFFAVSTNKKEVYKGEGFHLRIAFYEADRNRAQLQFHNFYDQLREVTKKVKPANCWEETFEITEIKPEKIEINGKGYSRYTLYEATFFPLSDEDIKIPQVGFKMIKYKVAKNPSFFGRNRQEDFKTYYSRPINIKVKALPEHPMKNQVAVGQYELKERMSADSMKTGQNMPYAFIIQGLGNINAIQLPAVNETEGLTVYDPDERSTVIRSNARVTGRKLLEYAIMPKEPGKYDFDEIFSFIYFDPYRQAYDTLVPSTHLLAFGPSLKNKEIESADLGDFYSIINDESNNLINLKTGSRTYTYYLLLLFIMAAVGLFFYFRKVS